MLDVTEQLRQYGETVTDTVEPVRAEDIGSITTEPSGGKGRRPVWQPLLAAAAVVAVLVGGYWFVNATTDSAPPAGPTPSTGPPPTSATTPTTFPAVDPGTTTGIQLLDPGPLAPRAGSAVVWDGTELVVWGGSIEPVNMGLTGPDQQFADGATYNPTTRAWRKMADGPLPTTRGTPVAVSTDAGVVIALNTATARWDPMTDRWQQLGNAPAPVTDLVFTGTHALSATANAELDLASGTWRTLPTPPQELGRQVAAWDGTELIVVGQRLNGAAGAIAFDPERNAWRALDDPPGLNATALSADRDGDRAVFLDYQMNVAAFSLRTGWEQLPSVPAQAGDYTPRILATQPGLVVTAAQAVAVRDGDNPWIPVPRGELEFWGSEQALVPGRGVGKGRPSYFEFGISPSGTNRFALVNPQLLGAATRTLQVGGFTLQLPPDTTFLRSEYTTPADGPTVLVEVRTPTGNCQITSTDDGGTGGAAHPWSEYASGLTWSARPTSSDAAKVVCLDPNTAKQIVDATTFP